MSTSDPSGGERGSGSGPQSPEDPRSPGGGAETEPVATEPQQSEQQQQQQAAGAAAPGWYADPQSPGLQRWWDGIRWTEHVHPPAGGAEAGQFGGASGQPAQSGGYLPQGAPYAGAPAAANPRQTAMLAHLSSLAGLLIALNWLGPLIIYLVKKDDDPFVAEHSREALNFNLSVFLYMLGMFILTFVLVITIIGPFLTIPIMIAIGVAWIVLTIIAAVKANNGEHYRYPLTIRMVS